MDSGARAAGRIYVPRQFDTSVLYKVVSAELDGFLSAATKRGRPVPLFIERTFRDYLACGMASAGFVRVHCNTCGHDQILPFSCQRRGICPSCSARRMADVAANLVDFVLPEVGVRQWVLTLPFSLRYRLAYDRSLLTPVLGAFLRAVFRSLRRRVHERHGVRGAKCGAVTFVQRAGGSLNLNVHRANSHGERAICVRVLDTSVEGESGWGTEEPDRANSSYLTTQTPVYTTFPT